MTDGLKPAHRQAIIDALAANPKVERIVLFGSRAKGTFTLTSDVDLALFGDDLTLSDQAALAEAVAELSVPQRVDILIYHRIESQALREEIRKHGVEWFARERATQAVNMAEGWREVKLRDVVSLNPDTISSDWPYSYIKYIDISSVGDGLLLEPPKVLHLYEAPSRAKRLIREGDVVLSTVRPGRRSMFFVRQADPELVVSTGFAVLRAHREYIEPRFLYACIYDKAFTEYLVKQEKGAAYPAVLPEDVAEAVIRIPPLPEQRAIAHILGTLDDKIELNRRMSETLEGMARALFKAWFVDFEPVRAKLARRWQAGQSLPGLPAELYDLFPDRLVDSELGQIPEGWEVKSLDEIARFLNGLALQKYPPTGNCSLPVIKIAQLRAGHTNGADRASADIAPEYVVNDGDILFSWSGSLECVVWAGGKGALNQHLFKVLPNGYPRWLCYFGIHEHLEDFRHIAASKATTMGHIQRHHLSSAKLAVPSLDLLSVIDRYIFSFFEASWKQNLESRALAGLRDALLPKLISGEMRVRDAERFLEQRGL